MSSNVDNIFTSLEPYYKLSRIFGNIPHTVSANLNYQKQDYIFTFIRIIVTTYFITYFIQYDYLYNNDFIFFVNIEAKLYIFFIYSFAYVIIISNHVNWKRHILILCEIKRIDCLLESIGIFINHRKQRKFMIYMILTELFLFNATLIQLYITSMYEISFEYFVTYFENVFLYSVILFSIFEFQMLVFSLKYRFYLINLYLKQSINNKNICILCRINELLINVAISVNKHFALIVLLKWLLTFVCLIEDAILVILSFIYDRALITKIVLMEYIWISYELLDISITIYVASCVVNEVGIF